MAYRDREWFLQALTRARQPVTAVQVRINTHIESDEFDAAKLLLPHLADALANANLVANEFADKFGG